MIQKDTMVTSQCHKKPKCKDAYLHVHHKLLFIDSLALSIG